MATTRPQGPPYGCKNQGPISRHFYFTRIVRQGWRVILGYFSKKKQEIWEDFFAFEWPGVMKSQPPWGYQSYPYVSEYCCTLGTSSYLLLNHGHTLQNCDSKNMFYFAQYHLIYTPVNYLTFMPKAFIATERVRNLFDKFPVVNWGIICSRPPDNPSQIAGVASRFAQQGHHQCYLTERPTLWEWCSPGGWRGGGERWLEGNLCFIPSHCRTYFA